MPKIKLHILPQLMPTFCFSIALVIASCGYDCPERKAVNTNYFISDANRVSIPYRFDGKDTLTYISDGGDTAVLYGVGIKQYFERRSSNDETYEDCPSGDLDLCENLEYLFEGDKGKGLHSLLFRVYLWAPYYTNTSSYDQLGGFKVNVTEWSGKFWNNNDTFNYFDKDPDYSINGMNSQAFYTNKVTINAQEYWGFAIAKYIGYPKNTDTLLIYNKNHGALEIRTKDNLWKLDL